MPVIDTTATPVDTTVTATWRNGDGGKISVRRVRFASVGATWTARASRPLTQLPTCEQSRGDAGAIWRRYDPIQQDSGMSPFPFTAHGEVVTADSLRYQVDISAPAAESRDALASMISAAALRSQSRATPARGGR